MKIKDWIEYLNTLNEEKELLLYDANVDLNLEESEKLSPNRVKQNANGDYVIV